MATVRQCSNFLGQKPEQKRWHNIKMLILRTNRFMDFFENNSNGLISFMNLLILKNFISFEEFCLKWILLEP